MPTPENRVSLRPATRTRARAAAATLVAGATLVTISLVLPHPSGADLFALSITALGMALAGALVWSLAGRIPPQGVHLILASVSLVTCLLIYESGIAVGQYGTIFVWATLVISFYFPRRVAAIHLGWLLTVYAVVLPAGRKHRRLLALHPLVLHGDFAHRRDAVDHRGRRPPRPRRRARPALLRPLPRHALHRQRRRLLRRAERRLVAPSRLGPRGAARESLHRTRPSR